MGQALYRKHRPKSLKEVIGQEHITHTLEQALKQGRISHAYLFTGPRGTGKTSIARILAHEINGLPYTDDSLHIDIIEIDAASNRRIDEIRELRDKVYVAPTSAKYKVYIIDEVHMLTREAFNALLKTLEEPPAHVVFILATTDAHKLPETIVSRTQRFNFKPIEKSKVVAHLQDIARQEKLKVSPEALELLAEHGEGSFRDSISLMDQASSQAEALEAGDVQKLLGVPPAESLAALLAALARRDTAVVMNSLNDLYSGGYQAAAIAKQLGLILRSQLVARQTTLPPELTLQLLSELIEVPVSRQPERYLEISLLRALPMEFTTSTPSIADSEPLVIAAVPATPVSHTPLDDSIWPNVLLALKQRHNTLYGVVRMAQPSFSDAGVLRLAFAFAFHEKRIKEAANRQKIADIIHELTGEVVTVECSHDKSAVPPKMALPAAKIPAPADLTAISNIFGSAELLES